MKELILAMFLDRIKIINIIIKLNKCKETVGEIY